MNKQKVITNALVNDELPNNRADTEELLPGTRVIASPLADNHLAGATADLVSARWDNWDLAPWMAYLVDVCDESVLPYLADQFDVEGLRGFTIAQNEHQQREMIKKSIALHRYLGTPWAIREACKTIGFPIVLIEEGVTCIDGIERPEDWARFRVMIEGDETKHVTEEQVHRLHQFIEFYKNQRSELADLGFYHTFSEQFTLKNTEQRENLEVIYVDMTPTAILINPDGAGKLVKIHTNVAWEVQPSIPWDDDTDDRIYVEATTENEFIISSDPNNKANREKKVEVTTSDGILLATVHVTQHLNWHNAYSRAYSSAYNWHVNRSNAYSRAYSNAYNTDQYIGFSTPHIHLDNTGESVELEVKSNEIWKIV